MKVVVSEELMFVLGGINHWISRSILWGESNKDVFKEDSVNYLGLSHTDKHHLSYLTQDRIRKIEESEDKDYWKLKMRYHGRVGSVIKKIFDDKVISDVDIEEFVSQYNSIVSKPDFHFKIVKGEDIRKYYHYSKYYCNNGSLGMSCMKNDMCQSFFNIYTYNQDRINMLVMLDEHDKVMGRSLLWFGDDFKLMDRIYTINDTYVKYFKDWSKENGFLYKEKQNWNTPLHVIDGEDIVIKKLSLVLKKGVFDKYPYLDTFKWLDVKTRTLYNYMPEWFTRENPGKHYVLSDPTGGTMKNDDFMMDDITNQFFPKFQMVHLRYMNKNVSRGSTFYSTVNDDFILPEDCERMKEIGDYIFTGKYSYLNNQERIEERRKEYKNMTIEKPKVYVLEHDDELIPPPRPEGGWEEIRHEEIEGDYIVDQFVQS